MDYLLNEFSKILMNAWALMLSATEVWSLRAALPLVFSFSKSEQRPHVWVLLRYMLSFWFGSQQGVFFQILDVLGPGHSMLILIYFRFFAKSSTPNPFTDLVWLCRNWHCRLWLLAHQAVDSANKKKTFIYLNYNINQFSGHSKSK